MEVTSIPKIEEEYLMGTLDERPVIDRYFTKRYHCDPKGGDYTLLIHSNKICVIMLAPSHPIMKENLKITSVNFQVLCYNRLENWTGSQDTLVIVKNNRRKKLPRVTNNEFTKYYQNVLLDNRVTGKKKQGAQLLTDVSILCNIHCENRATPYIVRSGMVSKLMEVNERLIENPELLKSPREGFIAIIFPKRGEFEREIDRWISEEEYLNIVSSRD